MDQVYDKEENCCGCTACAFTCPVSAISMKPNEKGFLYPVINKEICIDCKRCVKVCPLKKEIQKKENQTVLALKNRDEKVRHSSSSGGFFSELAKKIIEKKGSVYGAVVDDSCNVVHKEINKIEDIDQLKGSKYVQSDIGDTYLKIKKNLEEGKLVLFSGTPCQVFGLYNYIKKDYENLITCDFVCHGVPSPKIFEEHKRYLEEKYKMKIKNINFRYKNDNSMFNLKLILENGDIVLRRQTKDEYYFLFLKNYILRESCYQCHFSNTNRVSDITMGDFWGIDKTPIKNFDDKKGVSLIIINTKEGMDAYHEIEGKFYVEKSNIKDCLQPNLIKPTAKPKKECDVFWLTYSKKGQYKKTVCKVKKIYYFNKVKNKIRKILKMRSKIN